jgi:hypothetical protein
MESEENLQRKLRPSGGGFRVFGVVHLHGSISRILSGGLIPQRCGNGGNTDVAVLLVKVGPLAQAFSGDRFGMVIRRHFTFSLF